MAESQPAWKTYEEVANYLIEQLADKLGLDLERVEGKQKLVGKRTGRQIEIEGKAVIADGDGEAFVVIECRRYTTSKLDAEDMGGLVYRMIFDLGGSGGILVTPIGVQEGGEKVANREGIAVIRLNADATTTDYVLEFLNRVFIGVSGKPMIGYADIRSEGVVGEGKATPDEPPR